MSRAKPGGSVARADNLFSGAMSRAMLYAKPGGGGSFCCSLTCSQGALFTQDIKCLPVPQQELGSSLCMVQPTGCLGLGQLQHDLGGETAVSRGRKAGRGPRGTQSRRRNTSWQRAEPTGVADGPRPPPARLGRHKCVSLRLPDCRGITSREITPGCHSNITSWDVPCCHPATSEGTPGMEGMLPCPRGG